MRYRALLATALVALAVGASGCTAARNGLGTRINSCVQVLPQALAAVGAEAHFAGVRSLGVAALQHAATAKGQPPPALPAGLASTDRQAECLVAFDGTFEPAAVTKPWAPLAGPYGGAVVVVRPSTGQVLATVLFPRVPPSIRFSKR